MTLSGSYYYGDHAFGHDGDTDGGSSGALVFNSAGAAVGLHHVGSASYNIARLFEWVVANTPDFASTVLEDIETWAPCSDDDGDLYGSPASPACLFAGEDCDDGNAAIHPGASEFCDEVDSDCIVGNEPYLIFYRDEDSDGWGTSDSSEQCFPSTPYSASVDGDCDDDAATVNPGATEVSCDEIDNDCLDGDSCICTDIDGDDYGDGPGCLGLDCNDSEPLAWSGATEVACDGVDNDCVGGDAPCPEITVISPTTGSVLTQGAASTVEWNSTAITTDVMVHIWKDGSFFTTLAASTPDTGSIPFTPEPAAAFPPATTYQACVSTIDSSVSDCGGEFSIFEPAPGITITSPVIGDSTTSTITVAGTQTDAPTVTWSNSAGGSGVCSVSPGTFSCLVAGLSLGLQTLTVTASNSSGTATDTLVVDYAPAPTILYAQDFTSSTVFSDTITGSQTFTDGADWWDGGLGSSLGYGSGFAGQLMNIYNPGLSASSSNLRLTLPALAAPSQDVIVTFWAYNPVSDSVDLVLTRETVDVIFTVPPLGWTEVSATLSAPSLTETVIVEFGLVPQSTSGFSFKVDEIEVTTP